MPPAVRVAVALGSNVGDRHATLRTAIDRLRRILGDVRVSPFYDTPPVGVGPQPRYLNAAIVGVSRDEPRALLDRLLVLEQELGRTRPSPGAPRTLDLDLILYGDAILDEPGLTVPHPRFRERAFVLRPLADIAADLVDPVTQQDVGTLWRLLPHEATVGVRPAHP